MDNLQAINHVYSYNNAVPMLDYVLDLCKYLDMKNNELKTMIDADEKKNEDLKYDYRVYEHKKHYSAGFKVYLYSKVQRNLPSVQSYAELEKMHAAGLLKQLSHMSIELDYSFGVGKYNEIVNHRNEFKIEFRPYDISFTRASDYDDAEANEIEDTIKRKLSDFVSYETIFGD